MAPTGIKTIDHSPEVVAQWLNELAGMLDWAETGRTYLLLHTTLHAVRDWLNPNEAADLAAQLPILVRGIYYEGWNPSATPVHPRNLEDFIGRIEKAFAKEPLEDPVEAVSAVFALLARHVTNSEIVQVRNSMHRRLRELWPNDI
jgi:uncharacterized protein (DUF2267 family)